jgi:type IV pilus assembly protein PilB
MTKTLADTLLAQGLLHADQIADIQSKMVIQSESFVAVLTRNQYLDETELALFLAQYLNIPMINLSSKKTDKAIIHLIPESMIRDLKVFPLFKVLDSIVLAMVDPLDVRATQEVEAFTNLRVEPVVVTLSELNITINKWLGTETTIQELLKNLHNQPLDTLQILDEGGIFRHNETHGPINKLAYLIISAAINDNASDIHLEPREKGLDVRFRLDGVLHKIWTLPTNLCQALTSSIKILAKMDIVEKRLPLDGSFRIQTDNKVIDIRVSSYPMLYGEKIVLRILDQESMVFDLDYLGMSGEMKRTIKQLTGKNHGIFLVTGPTGSGKTTTLYAALNQLRSIERNILTIEDPIEYHIPLINQSEVNPKAGLSFARGLRSLLRQDPDIILIGEIRDQETAQIAFQAALTGHLVFSTLHTNDTASSIVRLIDMGIEPYLISSTLLGVLSQRLVRKICTDCRDVYNPNPELLQKIGLPPIGQYLKGSGCNRCRNTGYKGRTGLFELLVMNDQTKALINSQHFSELEIREHRDDKFFISLMADGIQKVHDNITTIEEVLRVVQ